MFINERTRRKGQPINNKNNSLSKRGGHAGRNQGIQEVAQKDEEDAPLTRSAILPDLGWGELTTTLGPLAFLRKRWEIRPKQEVRAW